MNKKIYRVLAFQKNGHGGNPAGVVLGAEDLSEAQMKAIAQDVGYSETAFVMDSERADFKVRFFTPVDEVDLCGHATIATFNLLRDLGKINAGTYTQETKAGILKLRVYEDCVYMEQNLPVFHDVIPKNEISLCFDGEYIGDLPIQIVSTGLKDIILPIKDLASMNRMKGDSRLIAKISEQYDAVGIHAFALETVEGAHAHTRNFAPRYGIEEESATGTASGALACYLTKHFGELFGGSFVFEQGYTMGTPSEILVEVKSLNGKMESVYVGGRAGIL